MTSCHPEVIYQVVSIHKGWLWASVIHRAMEVSLSSINLLEQLLVRGKMGIAFNDLDLVGLVEWDDVKVWMPGQDTVGCFLRRRA